MAYTIPPDTRTVGSGNPPLDINNVSDVLTGSGLGFSILNTAYAGGADPTGTADSTAAINAAVTAASAASRPVRIPAGTYKVSSTLNWKLPGLVVIGDGANVTKIQQATSNTTIVQVAGQCQKISGINFSYATQQNASNTSSICMSFGDDTAGSCFMSHFSDLRCSLGAYGMAINPAITTAAGLFSCQFDNNEIIGYSISAINFQANAGLGGANCTGCVFNNTYVHNNFTGSDANSSSWPVRFQSFDDLVLNQFNIEHAQVFNSDAIALTLCGSVTINALHLEHLELSGNPGFGLVLTANAGTTIINGISIRFCTMTGTSYNGIFRFSGSGASLICNGLNEPADGGIATVHPLIDFSSATNVTARVRGITASQHTVTSQLPGTGCQAEVESVNTTWTPADSNLLLATGDPMALTSTAITIAGTLYLMKLPVRYLVKISSLWFLVTTIGAGTSTTSFVGLYSSAGALLSGSSDISTPLKTLAPAQCNLTTPQTLAGGTFVWAALLTNLGTTQPTLLKGLTATGNLPNVGLTAASYRWAINGTGLSALPGTITPASNSSTNMLTFWAGAS